MLERCGSTRKRVHKGFLWNSIESPASLFSVRRYRFYLSNSSQSSWKVHRLGFSEHFEMDAWTQCLPCPQLSINVLRSVLNLFHRPSLRISIGWAYLPRILYDSTSASGNIVRLHVSTPQCCHDDAHAGSWAAALHNTTIWSDDVTSLGQCRVTLMMQVAFGWQTCVHFFKTLRHQNLPVS